MPIIVKVDDWEKLETLKEELANVYKHAGYMASADIVKSYLERRVNQLQDKIELDERTKGSYKHEYNGD